MRKSCTIKCSVSDLCQQICAAEGWAGVKAALGQQPSSKMWRMMCVYTMLVSMCVDVHMCLHNSHIYVFVHH